MRNETIRLPFIFPKLTAMKSEPKWLKLIYDIEGPAEINPCP